MLMSKSKKTLEMSLFHTLSFKASDLRDARVEGFVLNVDYCKIGAAILFKRNIEEKRRLLHTHVLISRLIFLFVQTLYSVDGS